MAYALVDDLGFIQMHPGTILKVEEGQDCGLLCASDDTELSSGRTGAAETGPNQRAANTWSTATPPVTTRNAATQANPSGTSGSSQTYGGTSGGQTTTMCSSATSSGGACGSGALGAVGSPKGAAPSTEGPLPSGGRGHQDRECGGDDDGDLEYEFGDGDGPAAATVGPVGEGSSAGDDTETFSELSDPGGTEVVFVREGVGVWPGARAERIFGRLSLVKQCGVLFMAWLPYSRGVLQPDGTFRVTPPGPAARAAPGAGTGAARGPGVAGQAAGTGAGAGAGAALAKAAMAVTAAARPGQEEGPAGSIVAGEGSSASRGGGRGEADAVGANDRTLYAVHPIPLSEVRALRRRVPPLGLGCPSLVVVLTSGVTLPPLYFHRGGIKALIATLKQHAFLLKSASEPHTYLVNDTADPLSRSLCALQLADVLIGGPPPGASATFEPGGSVLEAPAPAPAPAVTAKGPVTAPNAAAAGAATTAASWVSPAGTSAPSGSRSGYKPGGGCKPAAAAGGNPGYEAEAEAAADGWCGAARVDSDAGLGADVTWSWADPPRSPVAGRAGATRARGAGAAGAGGRGADADVDAGTIGYYGGGDTGAESEEDGGSGGASSTRQHAASAWAYGIVDAINRFVQNVRGTASGWIGAFDELDDIDGDLYGGYGEEDDDEYGPTRRRRGWPGVDVAAPEAEAEVCKAGARADGRGLEASAAEAKTAGAGPCNSGGGLAAAAAPAGHPREPLRAAPCATTEVAANGLAGGGVAAAAAAAAAVGGAAAAEVASTGVGDFELLDGGGCWGEAAAHPLCRRRVRPPPLSPEEWAAMFDEEGRLVREAALRDRVCLSGCASELRREVWKHLLGLYPRGSTAAQRAETAQRWQTDYANLRRQWQSLVPEQEARCSSWRCHRTAVDKDVRRTDRTHPFFAREGGPGLRALRNVLLTHVVYDRDLGYCQGMSDLAAPLLVVMRDEAEAFWAFAALMGRMGGNFHTDLQGMTLQLEALRRLVQLLDPQLHAYLASRDCLSYYFAFRWLLILFKREFKFDEVLSLWEACWACRRTRHLHLYLAAAVLVQHRRVILSSELDFDGLLRLSIGLAGRLELQPLLETAEALAGYAGEAGREVTAGLP